MEQTFGHFSEREIEEICSILDGQNVAYTVNVDSNVVEQVKDSMKNNLRHYQGSTICNDLLQIRLDPEKLAALSPELKDKLQGLRLFWEEPEFDFEDMETSDEKPSPQSFVNSQEARRNWGLGVFLVAMVLFGLVYGLGERLINP